MCFNNLINYFNDRNQCFVDLNNYKTSNQILMTKYEDLEKQFDEVSEQYTILDNSLRPSDLESYWNDKRVKSNSFKYPGRPVFGSDKNISIDPRIYLNPIDDCIPIVTGNSVREKAMNAITLVKQIITYITDISQFKDPEVWLFCFEIMKLLKDDCEGGATLIANILLKSEVPYWRIRLNGGDVKGGGHAWCTVLFEEDNEWYIADWCFWPEDSLKGLKYKDAEDYFNIWFSCNTKYIYLDETYDRTTTESGINHQQSEVAISDKKRTTKSLLRSEFKGKDTLHK